MIEDDFLVATVALGTMAMSELRHSNGTETPETAKDFIDTYSVLLNKVNKEFNIVRKELNKQNNW
jgi:hypothetical protein